MPRESCEGELHSHLIDSEWRASAGIISHTVPLGGHKLGSYESLEPLGVGGMGEVFRARDSKLKRDVAIKVVPARFGTDIERIARF